MSCEPTDPCMFCRAAVHDECLAYWGDDDPQNCACGGEVIFTATGEIKQRSADMVEELGDTDTGYIADGYEAQKDISEYKDPVSTGRKRAAQIAPISAGLVCEWAGLKYAGGGVKPIVGCIGRPASDRHHGPDKNTMNNLLGVNLHRICDHCHNTWHAINDPYYGERPNHTEPFVPIDMKCLPHDPKTKATTTEIIEFESRRLNAN